jgi:uncharacterized protein (DUF2225 family)
MDLMSGHDKFGLNPENINDLYDDDKVAATGNTPVAATVQTEDETDFVFAKNITCPVCDKSFQTLTVRTSRVRFLGSDDDFRPVYKGIDTKYGVTSCPHCGYSAMNGDFIHVSTTQIRLLKEQVAARFKPGGKAVPLLYSYNDAIDRFKLALFSAIVKRAPYSEKAYICLKLSWLYRGLLEQFASDCRSTNSEEFVSAQKSEKYYYEQALDGMTRAVETEHFPICGMNQDTVDLLLAQMNYKLDHLDVASKLVARVLISKSASRHIKDKALDLKNEIIKKIRDVK